MKKLFTNLNGILFTALETIIVALIALGYTIFIHRFDYSQRYNPNSSSNDIILMYALGFSVVIFTFIILIAIVLACFNYKKYGNLTKATTLLFTISINFIAIVTIVFVFYVMNLYNNAEPVKGWEFVKGVANVGCILLSLLCMAKSIVFTIHNFKNKNIEINA